MGKRVLDLFAGIGGFSLAAHWMGWATEAFCERDAFCQQVLRKNFGPNIEIHDDIRTFTGKSFRGRIDIITGGFPCQPFSQAGKRIGVDDERYLFPEALRVVREVQPAWFVLENVNGLLSMANESRETKVAGRRNYLDPHIHDYEAIFTRHEIMLLGVICEEIELAGYKVQPVVIPASAVGAWHERKRIWIVAHADSFRERTRHREIQDPNGEILERDNDAELGNASRRVAEDATNAQNTRTIRWQRVETDDARPSKRREYLGRGRNGIDGRTDASGRENSSTDNELSTSNPNCGERSGLRVGFATEYACSCDTNCDDSYTNSTRLQGRVFEDRSEGTQSNDKQSLGCGGNWDEHWLEVATRLCRVDAGVSDRVDRLKSLGNSIVPNIAFEIFRAIEASDY